MSLLYSLPDKDRPIRDSILPLEPWHIASILPEEFRFPDISRYEIGAIRTLENYQEIWLLNHDSWNDIIKNELWKTRFILIYRTDTKTWRKIPAQVGNENVFVDKLFVMKDNSIWGKNVWTKYNPNYRWPILSRFEDGKQYFVVDQ